MKELLVLILFLMVFRMVEAQKFKEKNGMLSVEAENFKSQSHSQTRMWYIFKDNIQPQLSPDADPSHHETASNKDYLEILPDTRKNHSEELIHEVNFSNIPGKLGFLHYEVYFHNPGKYYVWVRTFSTGSEDNGIHVGLNGNWPESGKRMQWCEGNNQWTWASKQRTAENHCGEPGKIFLEIEKPGWHTISFSMREDGFELDKWIMTKEYEKPEGQGIAETLYKN